MSLKHRELELKLEPNDITLDQFLTWGFAKKPTKYLSVEGPDYFFSQGENIVRIRVPPGEPIEMTAKKRTNIHSLKDRVEVDLHFDSKVSLDDLELFLKTAGFNYEFKLGKRADIFWFNQGKGQVSISYYTAILDSAVHKEQKRSFLEIEASKDSDVSSETGKSYLKKWYETLQQDFSVKEFTVINNSLYEIFKNIKETESESK